MGIEGANLHWSPPLNPEDGHIRMLLTFFGLLELGLQHSYNYVTQNELLH